MKLTSIFKSIVAESTSDIRTDVEKYLDKLREFAADSFKRRGYTLSPPTYTASYGPKWIRVEEMTGPQRSVFCFIDQTGNLYKPASWNAPAKGVRGSIYDDHPPLDRRSFYR